MTDNFIMIAMISFIWVSQPVAMWGVGQASRNDDHQHWSEACQDKPDFDGLANGLIQP